MLSVYAVACDACGAANVPKRLPLARHPWMRAVRWTVPAAAVAGAAWFAFAPRPVPFGELLAQAEDACSASRFEDAEAICARVTAEHPGESAAWLLLARSRRGAGRAPELYVPAAERALVADPRNAAAHTFLARAEAARGRLPAAVAHASAATSIAPDDGDAWLLAAELEMRRPRPDLARVREALERALSAGAESRDAQILLADVAIRLNGAVGTGSERLSASATAALRRALAALDANRAREKDPLAAGATRARILLALGQPEEAFAAAEAAVLRVPPDTPPAATADVRLLRSMALHARGNRTEALRAFAEVLRDRPDAATAGAASAHLVASDDATAARDLLLGAAGADPSGGIDAVLASALLESRDLDGAAQAIAKACAASPSDPFFAEIRGAVREAEGRLPDARAAYEDAAKLSADLVGPRVRLALIVLAETPEESARPGAYDAAVAELEGLRARFDDDPLLLAGLGRLQLARGDAAAARAVLEAAAERRPSDADVWIALAEARRRCGDADALDLAAEALSRARRLRPTDAAVALREARAWIDAGKPDVAAAACGEHLRRRPGDTDVLRLRADAYARLAMWSLAADDLRRIRETGRAERDDVAGLVLALARSGDAAGANRVVDDARAASPADAAKLLARVSALAGGDAADDAARIAGAGPSPLAAWLHFGAGRVRDALAGLRALLRDRPGDPLVTRLLVTVLLAGDPPSREEGAEAHSAAAALPETERAAIHELIDGRMLLAADPRASGAVSRLREADVALAGDPLAALFLGEALLREGDADAGLAAVRRSVALAHGDRWISAAAAKRLLQSAAKSGDAGRAEELALEATRLDPALTGAAYRAVSLLHARGAFARAADVAEGALRVPSLAPEDVLRLRLSAVLDRRLDGDTAAAGAYAEELPPAARDSVAARLLRGFAELEAGRLPDAERLFSAVGEADPQDAGAVTGLVLTSLRRGDLDSALARLAQWTSAHTDDRDVALAACGELLRLGRAEAAQTLAAACAARHPRDAAAARLLARAQVAAGGAADAVRTLRDAAGQDAAADRLELRLEAASLAGRHGLDAESALADARHAAETVPQQRASARAAEAEILLTMGRSREAENAARAAIAAVERAEIRGRPERRVDARARSVLGALAAAAVPPRRAEAITEFMRSVDLDPADPEPADALARLLLTSPQNVDRAIDIARRLTDAEPGNPSRWDTLAEAARAAGRFGEARTAWTRALDLSGSSRPPDPARHGRVALRFARFLRDCDDASGARRVAEEARRAAAGTDVEKDLARFLAE